LPKRYLLYLQNWRAFAKRLEECITTQDRMLKRFPR
jgi:hypothetical protein